VRGADNISAYEAVHKAGWAGHIQNVAFLTKAQGRRKGETPEKCDLQHKSIHSVVLAEYD
jgi:hypothetical protein